MKIKIKINYHHSNHNEVKELCENFMESLRNANINNVYMETFYDAKILADEHKANQFLRRLK